jgi:hypothetical protein
VRQRSAKADDKGRTQKRKRDGPPTGVPRQASASVVVKQVWKSIIRNGVVIWPNGSY